MRAGPNSPATRSFRWIDAPAPEPLMVELVGGAAALAAPMDVVDLGEKDAGLVDFDSRD